MTEEPQATTDAMGNTLFAPVAIQTKLHAMVGGSTQVWISKTSEKWVLVVEDIHLLEEVGRRKFNAVEEIEATRPIIPSELHV